MTTNNIELPLDPEYITRDGFYMAGYIWGSHVRTEKDARQMFPGDSDLYEDFYKGVSDGYHDKLNSMRDEKNQPTVKKDIDATAEYDRLYRMYISGVIDPSSYRRLVDELMKSIDGLTESLV